MRTIRLILVLVFFVVVYAADPVKIGSPGAGGVVSNVDFGENKPTDSRWTLNGDVTTTPGLVRRRPGILAVGDNSKAVRTVIGFMSAVDQRKQVLGVSDGPDSVKVDTVAYHIMDSTNPWYSVWCSNLFQSGLQDNQFTAQGVIVGSGNVGVIQVEDNALVFEENTIPIIYTNEQGYTRSLTEAEDTTTYSPRVVSLGFEAPGQPRVGIIDEASTGFGTYRYSYKLTRNAVVNRPAIPSRWIPIDSNRAYVTAFELFPRTAAGVARDTIYVMRQKYGGAWQLHSAGFPMNDTDRAYFIDSFVTDAWRDTIYGSGIVRGPDAATYATGGDSARPGGLLCFRDSFMYVASAYVPAIADPESLYYVAYSYYDPVLGIESPLGPVVKGRLVNDSVAGTFLVKWVKNWTKTDERAKWIRVYRTVNQDTSAFYCLWQVRANQPYPGDTTLTRAMYPAFLNDTDIVLGDWEYRDTVSTGTFSYADFYVYEEDGGALVRPPLVTNCEIPFSTMAYANYRVWGAGDPLYPNRVYYSEYNELEGWLATDYIECGESSADEITALIALSVGVEDALLVFRHNDIWIIAGYDNETTVYPAVQAPARARYRLTDKCGTVNRKNTVLANDMIYFLSPSMKVYRTNGEEPQDIGFPIENYIDSYFVSFAHADSHVVAFRLDDRIVWYDSTVNRGLAYNLYSETWGIESYGTDFRPAGSFAYDTSANVWGRGSRSYWLYQSDSACQFRTEYSGYVDSTDTIYSYPFNYETPRIGDGTAFYMITEAQVTATLTGDTAGTYLVGYVIDETGDTLTSDSALVFGYSTVRMGFGKHVGRYLSVRFGVSGDNTEAEIHDVALYPIRVAQTRTR